MITISVLNQKGGVGKSTSTRNIAEYISKNGKKVLMVDLDPQGNLSQLSDKEEVEKTLADAFKDAINAMQKNKDLNPPTVYNVSENLDMIPNDIEFSGMELEVSGLMYRETILRNILDTLNDKYDICFVDCPPSLNIITVNGLAASNLVLIPLEATYFSYKGLERMIQTITMIKRGINKEIGILGIFLTKFEGKTVISQKILNDFKKDWDMALFDTKIRYYQDYKKAEYEKNSIYAYAKSSIAASDYRNLGYEILEKINQLTRK